MGREGQIFVSKGTALERLIGAAYEREDHLQSLLAEHPELLGGEQIDDEDPRRWLLVGKEVGISDQEGGPDRWSIDHVFIDQDAIPTFVEVKRSSDSRIRREVVGQLLEYAANAGRYWRPNHLETLASRTTTKKGTTLEQAVAKLVGGSGAPSDDFWRRADQNLRSGAVRLIFVADEIPPELRTMAEFLNDQMTTTEVLAVEVRQYVADSGLRAFVPFVKNATAKARDVKASALTRRQWGEDDFTHQLRRIAEPEVLSAAEKVFRALKSRANSVYFGRGRVPSFSPRMPEIGPGSPITLWTDGALSINYGNIGDYGEANGNASALRLRQRLLQAFGPLVNDIHEDPNTPRYPRYEGVRWAPHVDALLTALLELSPSPRMVTTADGARLHPRTEGGSSVDESA